MLVLIMATSKDKSPNSMILA